MKKRKRSEVRSTLFTITMAFILTFSIFYAAYSVPIAEAKEFEAQKFKTVFTVQFNAITLEEAARLEEVFKGKFSDACKIGVTAKAVELETTTISDAIFVTY